MVVEYDAQRSALYTPERRDTLFEKGVLYSPLQLAIEAARLAYYRAEGAPAEMRRLSDALDRVGFSEPRMFTNQKTGPPHSAACAQPTGWRCWPCAEPNRTISRTSRTIWR